MRKCLRVRGHLLFYFVDVILLGKAISAAFGFCPCLDFIGFAQSDFTCT